MSTSAAGGGEDGDGGGHPKRKNTNGAPDKKISMLERGILRYMQGKTADAIARGEEPPWDAFMLH
jgi:hypothetical protein